MGTTTLIWDHHRVALWRAGRQGCVVLADGAASTAEAVVDFLESYADALSITRLRIYVDLPGLDHHIERIPQIGAKLQKQLLEQRSKKHYGNEPRAWSASPMQLEEKTRALPQECQAEMMKTFVEHKGSFLVSSSCGIGGFRW